MKYTYQDIADKSRDGLKKELHDGIITAGMYMYQTAGFPVDVFIETFNEKFNNKSEQWLFYMNFRNKYPKAYEKTI